MKTTKLLLAVIGLAALCGCTITRSRTTINTPAVFMVSTNAQGILSTNMVSPATIEKKVVKERMLLPPGYVLLATTEGEGLDFSAIDPTSGNPGRIRLGVFRGTVKLFPSSEKELYAPPFTEAGSVKNGAVPFSMTGNAQFSAGPTRVSSGSNTVSGAIVPSASPFGALRPFTPTTTTNTP